MDRARAVTGARELSSKMWRVFCMVIAVTMTRAVHVTRPRSLLQLRGGEGLDATELIDGLKRALGVVQQRSLAIFSACVEPHALEDTIEMLHEEQERSEKVEAAAAKGKLKQQRRMQVLKDKLRDLEAGLHVAKDKELVATAREATLTAQLEELNSTAAVELGRAVTLEREAAAAATRTAIEAAAAKHEAALAAAATTQQAAIEEHAATLRHEALKQAHRAVCVALAAASGRATALSLATLASSRAVHEAECARLQERIAAAQREAADARETAEAYVETIVDGAEAAEQRWAASASEEHDSLLALVEQMDTKLSAALGAQRELQVALEYAQSNATAALILAVRLQANQTSTLRLRPRRTGPSVSGTARSRGQAKRPQGRADGRNFTGDHPPPRLRKALIERGKARRAAARAIASLRRAQSDLKEADARLVAVTKERDDAVRAAQEMGKRNPAGTAAATQDTSRANSRMGAMRRRRRRALRPPSRSVAAVGRGRRGPRRRRTLVAVPTIADWAKDAASSVVKLIRWPRQAQSLLPTPTAVTQALRVDTLNGSSRDDTLQDAANVKAEILHGRIAMAAFLGVCSQSGISAEALAKLLKEEPGFEL